MENVKKYSNFIKRIVSSPPAIRKKMLTTSNHNIIKAICEIILNIYYKHIPLSASALQALKKNKIILLQPISRNKSITVKKTCWSSIVTHLLHLRKYSTN